MQPSAEMFKVTNSFLSWKVGKSYRKQKQTSFLNDIYHTRLHIKYYIVYTYNIKAMVMHSQVIMSSILYVQNVCFIFQKLTLERS